MGTNNCASDTAREPTDYQVINEVLQGDREIFRLLVRRYNQQLYRVGASFLRDRTLIEDAMQEAYLKAFLNLDRFRQDSSFSTWLTRIMINECLMFLRSAKKGAEVAIELVPEPPNAPNEDCLQGREIKAILEAAVHSLPLKLRNVYILREVQQLTTTETAACLNLTESNVKVTLHRARQWLKERLLRSAEGIEIFPYPARFCDPFTETVMAAIRAIL